MGFFLIVGILALLGVIGFGIGRVAKSENPQGFGGVGAILALMGAVVLILLVAAFRMFHTVDNGHIGIVKQFGSLVGTTGEGLATTAPWQSLSEVSVQEEQNTYEMTREGGGTAVSSDSQEIGLVVQVRYQLQRGNAVELYRATGGHYVERILDPAVFQNTKEVTANYKAIEFAKNREAIRKQIEEAINTDTEPHGILVKNVTIKNFVLSRELNNAIEETIKAEQNAKRAEAQVTVVKAEADAAAAKAEGEKRAAIARAQGDAEANRLRSKKLTPLLVQWEAIQKLNPNVQVIVCPPRTVCIPNATPVNP